METSYGVPQCKINEITRPVEGQGRANSVCTPGSLIGRCFERQDDDLVASVWFISQLSGGSDLTMTCTSGERIISIMEVFFF